MVFDVTTTLNLILSLIIVILGLWVFKIKKYLLALYISLAFALFAFSHLAILLGITSTNILIITFRSLGYLVIIFALLIEALKK
ncbi:hypothetical protein [Methanobacterium spitsbergense]|uniref:Uncharacterized protein n=1 Tax=Methanobacterium spitsbergense TaxID=2874285 RepID=A0A8T5V0A3_9EURY|nr:hypothetical protein [Methanobacterium spitsbergense]MBZ2166443.1 hypothetical protein [Methanobacterium spitsbergense]